jgi:hypothetical protein
MDAMKLLRLAPRALAWLSMGTLIAGSSVVACSGSGSNDGTGRAAGDDASTSASGEAGGVCSSCLSGSDCASGSACVQIAGDSYCLPTCSGSCGGGTCASESDYAGNQVSVCVPSSGPCAAGSDAGTTSGGDAGASNTCGTLVGPTVKAGCSSCGSSGTTCQTNGCYGGWWCDTATNRCHPAPTTCSSGGGDGGTTTPPPVDAGPPPTGSVNASGGKVSSLFFGVVGDTRPPLDDDTSAYPSAIISSIYKNMQAAAPEFVVSTGDYMFASPAHAESGKQLDLYLAARAAYSGTLFPAFGNHECTGQVTSNCGPSGADGLTTNYNSFVSKMLAPIGQTKPYYSIRVDSSSGAWTAKFVFVAANAWDSTQQSWLDSTLATPTTYTFIVRHEPAEANTAPGTTPSETIMAKHPYTLAITGHTHLYSYHSPREVVFGNGGAPLTGTSNYGYGLIRQRSDGAIVVEEHDYSTGAIDSSFTFALTPAGAPTR